MSSVATSGNFDYTASVVPFAIGMGSWLGNLNTRTIGRLALAGVWDRVLTTDDLAALYNGGSGLNYREIAGSSKKRQLLTAAYLQGQQ